VSRPLPQQTRLLMTIVLGAMLVLVAVFAIIG
jgi:hypothetical protein